MEAADDGDDVNYDDFLCAMIAGKWLYQDVGHQGPTGVHALAKVRRTLEVRRTYISSAKARFHDKVL
jgi:hypothetical protein